MPYMTYDNHFGEEGCDLRQHVFKKKELSLEEDSFSILNNSNNPSHIAKSKWKKMKGENLGSYIRCNASKLI